MAATTQIDDQPGRIQSFYVSTEPTVIAGHLDGLDVRNTYRHPLLVQSGQTSGS